MKSIREQWFSAILINSYNPYLTIRQKNPKISDANPQTTRNYPVHFLENLNSQNVLSILLQPKSNKQHPTVIPIPKRIKLSTNPFKLFLVEIKNVIKGMSKPTSKYDSYDMFRGRQLLKRFKILGVSGKQLYVLQVTDRIVVPKKRIKATIDLNDNNETPNAPVFQKPIDAY